MALGVIGRSEFIMGFSLAGIRFSYEVSSKTGFEKELLEKVKEASANEKINIVVIDEELLNSIDKEKRMEIESSVAPVFVPLSTIAVQDNLRYLIKKSIGVDILAH